VIIYYILGNPRPGPLNPLLTVPPGIPGYYFGIENYIIILTSIKPE
jgi:hypothetical protein